jgi:hypothetical protein
MQRSNSARKTETVPRPDTWITIRDRGEFFSWVNLLSTGYERAELLVRAADWEEAFSEYRRVFFNRLSRLDISPLEPRTDDVLTSADQLLENRISLLGTDPVDIGSPIDWFITPGGDKQWQSHLGYLYFPNCLVSAYQKTRDARYLDKWMTILTDFMALHPIGVDGLDWSRANPMYRNELAYGCGGEGRFPEYAGGSWIGLSCPRVLLWISSLATLGNDPQIPDEFLANLLISIMRDHASVMIDNPRRYTPNQFFHVALALTSLGIILPEYRTSSACYLIGIERLETSMHTTAAKDGSDMEQSFNYNSGLPGRFYDLLRLYEGETTPRIESLLEIVHRRCRFLAAMTSPLGTWPQIAKTHGDDVTEKLAEWAGLFGLDDVKAVARAREQASLETDAVLPAQTAPVGTLGTGSIAFPYGGYYVLRTGYDVDDVFMLFKASRQAIGHMHEDCNSFALFAYGRRLLIDSGNYNYADDVESQRKNRYFFSSMSHNTVTIDGMSQARLGLQDHTDLNLLEAPIDARWYDSSTVAVVEGFYADGYTAATAHPAPRDASRLDGSHHRIIVWLKPDIWIVIDRLILDGKAGADHHFTSHWQLSPDFQESDLEVDESGSIVRTVNEDGANVAIVSSVGAAPKVVTGHNEPYEGWIATEYNEASPSTDISFSWNDDATTTAVHLVLAKLSHERVVESCRRIDDRMVLTMVDGRSIMVVASCDGSSRLVPGATGGDFEGGVVCICTTADSEEDPEGRREIVVLDATTECAGALGLAGARDIHFVDGTWSSFGPVVDPQD